MRPGRPMSAATRRLSLAHLPAVMREIKECPYADIGWHDIKACQSKSECWLLGAQTVSSALQGRTTAGQGTHQGRVWRITNECRRRRPAETMTDSRCFCSAVCIDNITCSACLVSPSLHLYVGHSTCTPVISRASPEAWPAPLLSQDSLLMGARVVHACSALLRKRIACPRNSQKDHLPSLVPPLRLQPLAWSQHGRLPGLRPVVHWQYRDKNERKYWASVSWIRTAGRNCHRPAHSPPSGPSASLVRLALTRQRRCWAAQRAAPSSSSAARIAQKVREGGES